MMHDFRETCAILCIGKTKLNELCKERKIGFVQERYGCKRSFSDKHIEDYLRKMERRAV